MALFNKRGKHVKGAAQTAGEEVSEQASESEVAAGAAVEGNEVEPEPEYEPAAQKPYEPAFSWALPASETVQPGGNSHCYTDSNGVLQIRFTEGESKIEII